MKIVMVAVKDVIEVCMKEMDRGLQHRCAALLHSCDRVSVLDVGRWDSRSGRDAQE